MTKPPPTMRNVVVPLVWSRCTVATDVADCLTFRVSSYPPSPWIVTWNRSPSFCRRASAVSCMVTNRSIVTVGISPPLTHGHSLSRGPYTCCISSYRVLHRFRPSSLAFVARRRKEVQKRFGQQF
jgi:hypothetical protein